MRVRTDVREGPGEFGVAISRKDGQGVLTVWGEVDIVTAPRLWRALETMLTEGERRIVLDVANLTFIDGSGLQVIAEAQTRSQAVGSELAVRSVSALTLKLFHIVGLAGALSIEAPEPEVSRSWHG
jgi:anti-sigma B factor antagonist